MKSIIITIRNLIRFNNWWHSKVSLLMGLTYWALSLTNFPAPQIFFYAALILLWIFCSASLGHFINDLYDAGIDAAAGKKNHVSRLSAQNKIIVLAILLTLLFIPPMFFALQKRVLIWIILQLMLFVAYSHSAIRLKEKLWAGIVADSLYAFLLPVAVILEYAGVAEKVGLPVLCLASIWLISQGVRNILLHQVADFAADIKAGVKTLATISGQQSIYSVVNFILLPIEILSLAAFLFLIIPFSFWYIVVIFLIWSGLKSSIMWSFLKTKIAWNNSNHPSYALLNNFYEQVLPFCFAGLLILKSPLFIFLLCLHLVLFAKPLKDLMQTCSASFNSIRQQKI